jgi:arylsulfatase
MQDRALEFIARSEGNPFFLYYATQIPHGPVIVDDFSSMQNVRTDIPQPNREWAAMVIKLDDFVGELVEALRSAGILANTIIFFASDNGYAHPGYFGRGGYPDWPDDPWFKNKGPFRGGKFHVMEGGCRVPFFVNWEGKISPGICSEPVWLPDFFPTAAKLAGDENEYDVDGTDIWPLLYGQRGDFNPSNHFYFSNNREQAVRMGPWKGYRESPEHPLQLYLIEEDTYSERNLSAHYPKVVSEIVTIMDSAYTPHDWYWTPDETAEDYKRKVETARETGMVIPLHWANGLKDYPRSPNPK